MRHFWNRMIGLTVVAMAALPGRGALAAEPAPVDTSTPKAAAKSFQAAVARGDGSAVRQLLVVKDDPGQELAGAYVELILAGKRLGEAARQRYPGVADAFAQGTIAPEDAERIDKAAVTEDGDRATLKLGDGETEVMELERAGGGWRVAIGEAAAANEEERKQRVEQIRGLAEAMSQSAEEISAGKYPTAQEAEDAVKEKLGAVLRKAMSGPTSRPATREARKGDNGH